MAKEDIKGEVQMSNKNMARHGCLLFGVAASMVLWHRLTAKNIKTINVERLTIRAAMPYNGKHGTF